MRAVKEVAAGFPDDDNNQSKVQQVVSYPARVRQFLHDVRMELRSVTWPSRTDVRATTVVVLIATFFFGFYLGTVLDVPLANLMTWLIENAPKWLQP